MPDPQGDPNLPQVRRVALHALIGGVVITLLKFAVFRITNYSLAVLSDAFESIINVAAAVMILYTVWLTNRPADHDHPYGHGKIEYLAVGLEGWLILLSGVVIAVKAVERLIVPVPPQLDLGIWALGGVGVLSAALAIYVRWSGRAYDNALLVAHGKHLITDVASTVAVVLGLLLVKWSNWIRLDPLVAMIIAGLVLFMSWRLLWQSIHGLMDRSDPQDDLLIRQILDHEVARGRIHGYHKVRHRHTGPFHWVDMHLQVDGGMTVAAGHELASDIEGCIEQRLGAANATAHLEPHVTDPRRVGGAPDEESDADVTPPDRAGQDPPPLSQGPTP